MYERDKPRMMEVTDPNRDLFSCMRGEHHQIVEAGGEGDRVRLSTGLMQLVAVDEMAATVIGDPHPRFGTELHGGELTPRDGARIGTIDFETWFATHSQGARR